MAYRIKTVADLIGVPRATLLAWERRYSVVTPARHANGYRAYTEADVTVLREVKLLVDGGLKVSEAVAQVRDRGPTSQAAPPTRALDGVRAELFAALLAFDRDRAVGCLRSVEMVGFADQLHGLYGPLLRELGDAWEAGRATIAQEHFASGFIRERIVAMLVAVNAGPARGGRVLCSGFDDDTHELPVLLVACHLALSGFRVLSIGVSVPVEALAAAVDESRVRLVCVSVTLPRSVAEVTDFARTLLSRLPSDCVVAFGGPGVPADLPTARRVRVPATMDALVALAHRVARSGGSTWRE